MFTPGYEMARDAHPDQLTTTIALPLGSWCLSHVHQDLGAWPSPPASTQGGGYGGRGGSSPGPWGTDVGEASFDESPHEGHISRNQSDLITSPVRGKVAPPEPSSHSYGTIDGLRRWLGGGGGTRHPTPRATVGVAAQSAPPSLALGRPFIGGKTAPPACGLGEDYGG